MRMTESTEDLQSSRMALIESVRQAKNKRTHDKTLEDALAGYDGLVADAYKTRELGLDTQVHRLKNIGRVATLNFQWGLPANFQDANWLIADHEGPQTLRNRVLEADYGWTLEGYEAEITEKQRAIVSIEVEIKQRAIDGMQQKIYELQGAGGDD